MTTGLAKYDAGHKVIETMVLNSPSDEEHQHAMEKARRAWAEKAQRIYTELTIGEIADAFNRQHMAFPASDAEFLSGANASYWLDTPQLKNQILTKLVNIFNQPYSNVNTFAEITLFLKNNGLKESAERIEELHNLEDLEDGEQPLLLESAQGFCDFILEFRKLGEPILGVFPQGTLSAGWRLADNRHLLIEFLERNLISFAMIGPDNKERDKKFRLNGRASREKVLNILSDTGVTEWPE